MACASCSTETGNKTKGCNSSGCSTGGCNRLNTYDWLADIKAAVAEVDNPYVEVSFKSGSRKEFYKASRTLLLEKHDVVVVEADAGGFDIGTVSLLGEMARLQMKRKHITEKRDWLKITRIATEQDIARLQESRSLEHDTMIRSRAIARQLNLEMKVGDVEYRADGKKATFFYIADDRVDFRELIKIYAKEFKVKIEMCHISKNI